MKGLLLNDIYQINKYCRMFFLLTLVFLVAAFFSEDYQFLFCYSFILLGALPMKLTAFDEKSKWNLYSQTLPITKTEFVSAKYLIGLLSSFPIVLLTAAARAIQMIQAGSFILVDFASFVGCIIAICLFLPALILPFVFRFGVEKARILQSVLLGSLCVLISLFSSTWEIELTSTVKLLTFAGIVLLYAISWGISISVYRHRDL